MNQEEKSLSDGVVTPKFANDREREMFALAKLGEDAYQFVNSELGRLIVGKAEQDVEEATRVLLSDSADPDTQAGRDIIRKARFDAAVASRVLGYIQETVNDGELAYDQLKNEQYEG